MSASSSGFFTPADYQIEHGAIKRVYDLSYYGYDLIYNVQQMNPAVLTNIDNSASATTFEFSQATPSPIRANTPTVLSNKASMVLAGPAAKTDLSVQFEITPDMDALLHEVNLLLPFGLNIDTYDTGSPKINFVKMTTTYEATGEVITKLSNSFTPTTAALGAPGTIIYVVDVTINPFIVLQKGQSIIIKLETNCNFGTGNTTGHAGLFQDLSFGKQLATPAPIYYYPSSMFAHLHPTTSHVNPQYITGDITP